MSDGAKFFGQRVRDLRELAGWTQETAASKVGLTFKYYQTLESGRLDGIRLRTMEGIASAYKLSLSNLFAEEIPQVKPSQALPPPHRKAPKREK